MTNFIQLIFYVLFYLALIKFFIQICQKFKVISLIKCFYWLFYDKTF